MKMRRSNAAEQSGAALLTTVMILGMLTALVAAYGANVRTNLGLRSAASIERLGFYTAEGGLNVGVTRFANIFRDSGTPEQSDFHQEVTIAERTADVTLAAVSGCNPCPPTLVPQGELFAGLHSIPYRYTVQSLAVNDESGDTEAHVAGEFDIHTIPIFQFLAFIDAHLFIMPLPPMTLHGRVHSNHRVHMQPDNSLTIEDLRPQIPEVQVTASDRIYRGGYKYDSTWRCTGTVTVDKLEDTVAPPNNLDPKVLTCTSGSTAPVSDATLSSWKGSMKQEVSNITTPDVGIINRSGEYWQASELRIALRLDQARATIDFGAADLCPAASNGTGSCVGGPNAGNICTTNANCVVGGVCSRVSPSLYQIEVQNEDGTQNTTKTRALWKFMCERRGALFYTDLANNPPATPNGAATATYVGTATNYTPAFTNNRRVYRRIGEDASGNGILTANTDRNDDICPPATSLYRPQDCTTNNRAAGAWHQDLDYRRGAFWNHREQQYMYLMNLNVRALIEWNKTNGDPLYASDDRSEGGLVWFLTVIGANSNAATNNYGVRVFDSADLDTKNQTFPTGSSITDPTGLTIVSDQAVIIQGNYNYKDKYPAAIMSDAQWVLSQGWEVAMNYNATPANVAPCSVFPPNGPAAAGGTNCVPNDQKSMYTLESNMRDVPDNDNPGGAAFNTSTALGINTALLFGLGDSTLNVNWYNGGLENFPRFLEDWGSDLTMNYRGSFVSLGDAQHKLANWQCGSGNGCLQGVYEPPTRLYDYDGDFNTVEKLPPKTPKIVYVQQLLYTRIFN